MVIYLLEIENYRFAFADPEEAVMLCIKSVEQDKKRKANRQILSDFGGMHVLNVDVFDAAATTAYVETMKVNSKVVLQVNIPTEGITRQAVVHKIILER